MQHTDPFIGCQKIHMLLSKASIVTLKPPSMGLF